MSETAEQVKDTAAGVGDATQEKTAEAASTVEDKATPPKKSKFVEIKEKVTGSFQQTSAKITGLFAGAKDKATKK